MSSNWKRKLNITKNSTYIFPPYVPTFHHFPNHSSPTLLQHLYPIPTLLQPQQRMSLPHHSLPLLHHHSLYQLYLPHYYLPILNHHYIHQQSSPIIRHMFSLHYRYWPPFSILLVAWNKWWILITHISQIKHHHSSSP